MGKVDAMKESHNKRKDYAKYGNYERSSQWNKELTRTPGIRQHRQKEVDTKKQQSFRFVHGRDMFQMVSHKNIPDKFTNSLPFLQSYYQLQDFYNFPSHSRE